MVQREDVNKSGDGGRQFPEIRPEMAIHSKKWVDFEIRSLVLLSLCMQIVLLFSGWRKKTSSLLLISLVFLTYQISSWVATYALGTISRGIGDMDTHKQQILAFWAPFLLLHLGGPDTITAYSREDNQLWLRHALELLVQVGIAIYVVFRAFPARDLIIPTVFVLVSGISKYGERTWSLKRGSMDGLRRSMLGEPDPGPDYAHIMAMFAARVPTDHVDGEEARRKAPFPAVHQNADNKIEDRDLLHVAYHFFEKYKGLFVDALMSFTDRIESRTFFVHRTPYDAFKVVEMELSFAFDVFYTKAIVTHTKLGIVIRGVCLSCNAIALAYFVLTDRSNFEKWDVVVTYILTGGALVLELIALARLLFSPWTIVLAGAAGRCTCFQWMARLILNCFCIEKPGWSNSVKQYNLLRFCLRDRRKPISSKILKTMGLKDFWDTYKDTTSIGITDQLKGFIYNEIKAKSVEAERDNNNYKRFIACRGEYALNLVNQLIWTTEVDFDESILIWHLATDICFHLDTTNHHNSSPSPSPAHEQIRNAPESDTDHAGSHEPDPESGSEQQQDVEVASQMAKMMSDYFLYLLVVQPLMLSSIAIIGVKRYSDTCADMVRFFRRAKNPKPAEACRELMNVCTVRHPKEVKGDKSKSALWEGVRLAKQLFNMSRKERWEVLGKVWVEMLGFAAIRCRGYYHAQQLSAGGELLTFVWFLMTHLGMGEVYRIEAGDASVRLGSDD